MYVTKCNRTLRSSLAHNPTAATPQTFQIKRIQLCAAVRHRCVTLLCCSLDGHTTATRRRKRRRAIRIMLLSVPLTLCLLWASGCTARSGAVILRDAMERSPLSLNDMFREVEELMEDTQHILDEAVDQVCVIFYSFMQGQCCVFQWRKVQYLVICPADYFIIHLVYCNFGKDQCQCGSNYV